MLHAEAVLLVDDGETELGEGRALLHERMRSHHQERLLTRHSRGGLAPRLGAERTGDEKRCDAEGREHPLESAKVLLGEEFGGRHDGRLIAVLEREHRGKEGDDRLATADIALQQPMHPAITAHVGHDLADRAHLRPRELERQRLLQT